MLKKKVFKMAGFFHDSVQNGPGMFKVAPNLIISGKNAHISDSLCLAFFYAISMVIV